MRQHFQRLSIGAVLLVTLSLYLGSQRHRPLISAQQQQTLRQQTATASEADAVLLALQQKIGQQPQNGVLWAELGQFYLYQDEFELAFSAYQQALLLQGDNAEIYAALATVLYYQAGRQLTTPAARYLEQALQRDPNQVSALMLQASNAFTQGDYPQASRLWQRLLDSRAARVDYHQLVEAINMANMLAQQQQ
ncbi:heme lyase NrfEFG subunit NrfG [Serratia microhaemolytica]|uniref:TPR domain-containing protein n=1 Tax=Serratia microhaemolytica TaxID=2675110 RepID=UPI000FDD96F7|nr:heme lyase NrfEFG subunit NrfG [Serratia microhaemolytica]